MNWARFSVWTASLAGLIFFLAFITEYLETGRLNYIEIFLVAIFLLVAILNKKIFQQNKR